MDQIEIGRKKEIPDANMIKMTPDIYNFIKYFTPSKVTGSDNLPNFIRLGRVWKKDRKKKDENCLIIPPFKRDGIMDVE